jgi:hypothetical protein
MFARICQSGRNSVKRFFANQAGEVTTAGIVGGIVGIVVIGAVVSAMWGTFQSSGTSIAALTQTDAGTTTLKALWPVVIVVGGVGLGVAGIMYALKKFGVMD